MRYLPAHAQHIGLRRYQQDSFGFANPDDHEFQAHGGFLSVLCDGMGGMEHGDVASAIAVRAMLDSYSRKTPAEDIPAALERSVREANRKVIEAARRLGVSEGAGTTLVAAVTHLESLYFISVGDSAVFHVRDGQAKMVNRAHVFANLLDQAIASGKITEQQAEQHPEREALTSFIGIPNLREIDHNTEAWPLVGGDTILLASDGMFKTLDAPAMADCFTGHPRSWPHALVQATLARQKPGQDNVTVVSVTLDEGTLTEWIPSGVEQARQADAPGTSPVPQTSARKAWLVLAIFLVLAAIGAGGYWYFSSH